MAINLNIHLPHKKSVAVIPAADFLKIFIQTATFPLKMYGIIERYFLQKATLFSLKNELYSRGMFFAVRKEVFFIHNQIPVMNYPQYRRMRKLVHECCNYDGGNCILLDDGEECVCVQSISYSLLCKWFRYAVLPLDEPLETALLFRDELKRCAVCGQPFHPGSNRAKYCKPCATKVHRRQKTDSDRKRRLSCGQLEAKKY